MISPMLLGKNGVLTAAFRPAGFPSGSFSVTLRLMITRWLTPQKMAESRGRKRSYLPTHFVDGFTTLPMLPSAGMASDMNTNDGGYPVGVGGGLDSVVIGGSRPERAT